MTLKGFLMDLYSNSVNSATLADFGGERLNRRWALDAEAWRLRSPDGRSLTLNDAERRLLMRLFDSNGQVVAHADLTNSLRVAEEDFDQHRLEMLIHRLRRKAVAVFDAELPLLAVRGRGYAFDVDERPRR